MAAKNLQFLTILFTAPIQLKKKVVKKIFLIYKKLYKL